jgi:fatty-acyl-CoA synthase
MNLMVNVPTPERRTLQRRVKMMTAGAAPPAVILEKMEDAGFDMTHVYGLTEVFGPVVICSWHNIWNDYPATKRAHLKARQGVKYQVLEELNVVDPRSMRPVPHDGETIGEIVLRGNVVMKGYLHDEDASEQAFASGYFHSGDLGVMHADGYIEIKDRSKDIIISGGENISTIEVEGVLYRHPAVLEAAVVAQPDKYWGERPCAFVSVHPDRQITEEDIISFCRSNLAHFKCPSRVVFGELPKTATGKIQKFKLRKLIGA